MILDDFAPRIEAALRSLSVPGCSLAVVGADGVREARGYGVADLRENRPATETTDYHFCSVTKLLTATGIMRLAEQGRLGLEDEVARLLPELGLPPGITVRQLLNHTSTLKDDYRVFLKAHFEGEAPPGLERTLRGYQFRATGAPGSRVSYCNTGFLLLGALLERLGGKPVTEWMTGELLRPIDMKAGFRMLDPAVMARAATGYFARWDLMKFLFRLGMPELMRRLCATTVGPYTELRHYDLDATPIGGLVGSVLDFAAFLRDQLAEKSLLLGDASRKAMQTLSVRGAAGMCSRLGVGLGWKLGEGRHGVFLNHEGGAPGYTTEVRIYPGRKLGIVFASNRFAKRISRAFHPVFDALADAP
ncbi:MAG: beta-lactamase family protein [Deltaproteobacteria bacterium]|nr:beta-lactamase family protein [Deltaproteobacteria bacterium]